MTANDDLRTAEARERATLFDLMEGHGGIGWAKAMQGGFDAYAAAIERRVVAERLVCVWAVPCSRLAEMRDDHPYETWCDGCKARASAPVEAE